ncbi:MAG: hypothetical protein OEW90_11760 [Betaproteobacteria bacterium]|nr:hypothetical protein [Betaproteobacteria bacterium]
MEDAVDFRPGFRLSEIDVGVLMSGILASVLLARVDKSFALALLFTLAHFFLFCNVLRMSRPLELLWAALFVVLAASTILVGFPPWSYTLSAMLAVTVILAVVQVLRPSYHGVLWQRVNPDLPQWWDANRKSRT